MDKSRFFHSKRPQMNPSITVLASCLLVTSGGDDPVGKAPPTPHTTSMTRCSGAFSTPTPIAGTGKPWLASTGLQTGRSRTSTAGVGSTTQPRNGTRSARTSIEPCSQPDRRSTGSSRGSGSTGTTGTSTLGTATSSLPDRMVIATLRTTPRVMSTPWVERGPRLAQHSTSRAPSTGVRINDGSCIAPR